ncbi:MAG: hypothetical protein CSA62_15015 [Planctomycetota bacterium]|nr:MAG: hypothetical protein CSA62_15015 [Planctomycetota bacterium]
MSETLGCLPHLAQLKTDLDQFDPQTLTVKALFEVSMNLPIADFRLDLGSLAELLQLEQMMTHSPSP